MSPKRLKLLAEIEIAKRRALSDFYFFCNKVLGYDLMVPHVHKEMCNFLVHDIPRASNEQSTKILLEARGTFKSTVGTVAYPLWRLVKNPNLTILLNNEKQQRVVDFLRAIKGHITENDNFITLFGNLSCQGKLGKRWNENRIDILTRTKFGPNPSIDTASVTSSTVGKHADLIVNDDLVGESNIGTPEQLEKVDEFVKNLGAVLNPGGEMNFIGTRWHHLDTYNTQMEHIKALGKHAKAEVLIRSAYNEDGSLFFPERLGEDFLAVQRVKLQTYFFSCQYLNSPVNKDNALIQRIETYADKINDMDAVEFFKTKCNIFVTMDIAYTDTKRSDHTVIFITAVHVETGKRYVVDYHIFKTTEPQKVIDRMFEVEDLWKPVKWGIEANNYKSWLRVPLRDAMRKKNMFLNIDPEDGLMHYGKNNAKHLRMAKLAPVYNNGMCVIAERMTDLEDQLRILTYDGTKGHDDLLDAHAMVEEIIFWGSEEPANKYENEALDKDDEEGYLDRRYPDGYTLLSDSVVDQDAWLTF